MSMPDSFPPPQWTPEILRRRRQRALATALALGAFALLVLIITIVKLGGSVLDRPL